jgi:hypothetical protein
MASERASARGQERADVRVRRPVSRDGPPAPGRRAARYPELERRHGHDNRQQQTAAPSPPIPQSRDTPTARAPNRRPDPATLRSSLLVPLPYLPSFASPRQPPPSAHTHFIPACLICLTPAHLAAAPPEATQASRLDYPVQVLPGLSRKGGPARSGGPPFLAKPRREAKETPEGGAAACCAQGRNP